MRFGLALPSYSFPDLDYSKAARLRDFATGAEARGYESLWVIEHLLTARGLYSTAWLSPLETLSFVAGCTSRIQLATGILIAALRNPVFVAKEIASLQFLSGGRFELGIGVGWDAHEYEVAGVPLRERGRRTDEILGIFERLWTGEPVTHHGRYYQFDDVVIDPPLSRKPPLWLAGGSKIVTELSPDPENMAPTVLERICRHGDGWLGLWVSPGRYADATGRISRYASDAGREVTHWRHGMHVWCAFGTAAAARARLAAAMEDFYRTPFGKFERYCPCGTPDEIAAGLLPYVDAGCRSFNLIPLADSQELAIEGTEAVRAALRGAVRAASHDRTFG